MKKISVVFFMLFVLISFFKKDIFPVYAREAAENQYYCFFASVYSKEKDRCVSIFEKDISLMSFSDKKKIVKGRVLYSLKVKEGDSCISVTKNTLKPLNFKECCSLFVDISKKTDTPIKKDPILYAGDTWELIEFDNGGNKKIAWSIIKKKR